MLYRYQDNCKVCANYTGEQTCKAFPKQIPEEIWSGKNQHSTPYPGDSGILYEHKKRPFPEMTDELLAEINKESG